MECLNLLLENSVESLATQCTALDPFHCPAGRYRVYIIWFTEHINMNTSLGFLNLHILCYFHESFFFLVGSLVAP